MGDYIYAFSEGGATVHRTADLELLVELELPRNEYYNYYYGDVDISEEEIESEKTDESTFSASDIAWQEQRKMRKVRRLDFEIR